MPKPIEYVSLVQRDVDYSAKRFACDTILLKDGASRDSIIAVTTFNKPRSKLLLANSVPILRCNKYVDNNGNLHHYLVMNGCEGVKFERLKASIAIFDAMIWAAGNVGPKHSVRYRFIYNATTFKSANVRGHAEIMKFLMTAARAYRDGKYRFYDKYTPTAAVEYLAKYVRIRSTEKTVW